MKNPGRELVIQRLSPLGYIGGSNFLNKHGSMRVMFGDIVNVK